MSGVGHPPAPTGAVPRVVRTCAELVAIDSTNHGPQGESGEREVADHIRGRLAGLGYEPQVAEPAPRRTNLLVRVPGTDASLPAIMVHGHLDVVPVEPEGWSVDPFSGAIRDGYVWGRGASDMKYSIAQMVEILVTWAETGVRPRREVAFLFLADEEADALFGSEWLAEHRPEWFEGVAAAVGEGGGAPIDTVRADGGAVRIYPVASAERGIQHLRVTAHGVSGHGSSGGDNAVVHLVDALGRLAHHEWPWTPGAASLAFLRGAGETLGLAQELDTQQGLAAAIEALDAPLQGCVRSAARCSATPTVLHAGYKVNVVPARAHAEIDVRTVPGHETECLRVIDALLGERVTREFITDQAGISAPAPSPWFDAIAGVLHERDPDAVVLPFCLGGGTDAKALTSRGIDCYGFAPLGPNPHGPMAEGDHGVDERVAICSLVEGTSILERFLRTV